MCGHGAPFRVVDIFFAVRSWVIAPPVCPDLIYDRHGSVLDGHDSVVDEGRARSEPFPDAIDLSWVRRREGQMSGTLPDR